MGKKKDDRRLEIAAITILTILVSTLAVHFDAFERLARFVAQHDPWQLDELIIFSLFGGVAAFVLLIRRAQELRVEVDRRRRAEDRAVELARRDPLTDLPNRRVLLEELELALATVGDGQTECAVLVIDLDQFKPVNDVYGHAAGDAVLLEVASRLAVVIGGRGTVGRMGGDEFACIIRFSAGSDLPMRIAGNLIRSLAAPIKIGTTRLQIGSTIGISRAPHDGMTAVGLLHGADLAMYEGKRGGRDTYRFFDPEMDLQMRKRSALEADLRLAVEAGEIIPHFQPIVNLRDHSIIAFEALARWSHPTEGMISPDIFIPMAEDLGIIDRLFYAMLRQACEAAKLWPPELQISINVQPVQLHHSALVPRILAILANTGFIPSRLVVEITENSAIDDMVKARAVFAALQKAGVRISLDDFGKGYSSLNHLRKLRFNQLKIDGSFIRAMSSDESAKIVSAVTGLGRSLGMPVTAEGVETDRQADTLRELGCERAQGRLFGMALDANKTAALIARKRPLTLLNV